MNATRAARQGYDADSFDISEQLGAAAQAIVEELYRDPDQRADQLGSVFLACASAARAEPADCRQALRKGDLAAFLLPRVRREIGPHAGQRISGGWLGTFMAGDARPIDSQAPDSTDREALELANRALQRAESQAAASGDATLQRNLRWYRARLAHKSYEAIARADRRVAATVRTGVARARKLVLRVVHELQTAQPAPLSGEAPPELEPLRRLWVEQDIERLDAELERTRERHALDPHWLNLAGLVEADRGDRAQASACYELGLVHADAPSVRARLLNNLGNLRDDQGQREQAAGLWLRAHQLLPQAPAPLLNLICAASLRRDYASAQHHVAQLAELFSSGRLAPDERAYVLRRLEQNPKLDWLRETDAWRNAPARWLRAAEHESERAPGGLWHRLAERTSAALLALSLLLPGLALAATPRAQSSQLERASFDGAIAATVERDRRGGDSMGKPPTRALAAEPRLLAGDSMGRSGDTRPEPRRRPRR